MGNNKKLDMLYNDQHPVFVRKCLKGSVEIIFKRCNCKIDQKYSRTLVVVPVL